MVFSDMEERSAERARIKAERDERRRKQEEEKLVRFHNYSPLLGTRYQSLSLLAATFAIC